jgi:hypothetical protein
VVRKVKPVYQSKQDSNYTFHEEEWNKGT